MSLFKKKNTPQSITEPTNQEKPRKVALVFFLELIQIIAISLAIIIPIRYFLVQPFYVKGTSMEPNFFDREYLIIDELSYRLSDPKRGDIVVFHYPNNPKEYFIKRVIGLPGETVEIKDGKIKIYNNEHPNGFMLDEEPYLSDSVYTSQNITKTLSAGHYFVLGDNRPMSYDSRFFGPIDKNVIVGRVWLRGWPLDRWKKFNTPTYK